MLHAVGESRRLELATVGGGARPLVADGGERRGSDAQAAEEAAMVYDNAAIKLRGPTSSRLRRRKLRIWGRCPGTIPAKSRETFLLRLQSFISQVETLEREGLGERETSGEREKVRRERAERR